MSVPNYRLCTALLLCAACTLAASGQAVHYLTPQTHQTTVGETLTLNLAAGTPTDATPAPWPTDRSAHFYVIAGGGRENTDNVRPADPARQNVELTLDKPGLAVVGYDLLPTTTDVDRDALKTFLNENTSGLEPADLQRLSGPGQTRLKRVESAKTLIRVAGEQGRTKPSALGTVKAGQTVEIRPLADPTTVPVGSDLPLRVYVNYGKKSGVKVRATHVESGKTFTRNTDNSGATYFTINAAGTWRIEFHYAERSQNGNAGWTLYSSTLTFATSEQGGDR